MIAQYRFQASLTKDFPETWYMIPVRSGQHLIVNILSRKPLVGNLIFPCASRETQPNVLPFDGIVPDTGNTHICIMRQPQANQREDTFSLLVSIE